MRDKLWRGIHRHGAGWRAEVSIGRGETVRRSFPAETTPKAMQAWRADEQAKARVHRKTRPVRGTLAGDAKIYLATVAAMPTISDRRREIAVWVARFGALSRNAITPAMIRLARDAWLNTPRAGKDSPPLSPGTVNKRLRALSNLYTVLDGAKADNPVREVDEVREPAPRPRAIPYETIAAIIDALPAGGQIVKRHGKTKGARAEVSTTKIRIRCMAYCQITPKQLGEITAADLELDPDPTVARGRLRLPARRKGQGAAAVWIALLPPAVEAFRDFDKHAVYGKFSQQSLNKAWKRALKTLKLTGLRPYDLRHSFASLVYEATKDRGAVQQLMQHATWSTSERYAMSAEDAVQAAHEATVAETFAKLGETSGRK